MLVWEIELSSRKNIEDVVISKILRKVSHCYQPFTTQNEYSLSP